MLYRKIHTAGKKDYVVEISKTKIKYYIVSVRLTRARRVQILEFYSKQAEKLIKACGGIISLARRIEFPFNTLSIRDVNKILHDVKIGPGEDQEESKNDRALDSSHLPPLESELGETHTNMSQIMLLNSMEEAPPEEEGRTLETNEPKDKNESRERNSPCPASPFETQTGKETEADRVQQWLEQQQIAIDDLMQHT